MSSVKSIKKYVQKNFSCFGVNKREQISRLLYEIGKREDLSLQQSKTIPQDGRHPKSSRFSVVKQYLIRRRFPEASGNGEQLKPYLPELNFKPQNKFKLQKSKLAPKNVFVEEGAKNSYLFRRFKERFPQARFVAIPSLKRYVQKHRFSLEDYGKRRDNFFITREKHDFFKSCPCTASCVR